MEERERGEGKVETREGAERRKVRGRRKKERRGKREREGRDGGIRLGNKLCLQSSSPVT